MTRNNRKTKDGEFKFYVQNRCTIELFAVSFFFFFCVCVSSLLECRLARISFGKSFNRTKNLVEEGLWNKLGSIVRGRDRRVTSISQCRSVSKSLTDSPVISRMQRERCCSFKERDNLSLTLPFPLLWFSVHSLLDQLSFPLLRSRYFKTFQRATVLSTLPRISTSPMLFCEIFQSFDSSKK